MFFQSKFLLFSKSLCDESVLYKKLGCSVVISVCLFSLLNQPRKFSKTPKRVQNRHEMFTVTLCYAVHVVRIVKMSKGVRHSRNLASFSLMKSGERSEKCNYGNHANYGDSPGTRNYHKTREMDVFIASFVIALTHFPRFFFILLFSNLQA